MKLKDHQLSHNATSGLELNINRFRLVEHQEIQATNINIVFDGEEVLVRPQFVLNLGCLVYMGRFQQRQSLESCG